MAIVTRIAVVTITAFTLFSGTAHAYVDPGSGSVIVTAILGFLAAIGYTARKQFYKMKNFFRKNDEDL